MPVHDVVPVFEAASRLLLTDRPPAEVVSELIALLRRLIDADGYALWRCDPVTGQWAMAEMAGVSREFAGTVLPAAKAAWLSDDPFVIDRDDPAATFRRAAYEAEGIRKLMVLPLRIAGEPTASLVCYFREDRPIRDEEFAAGRTFANLAAVAIAGAQANTRLRERTRTLEELNELARTMSAELDLHRLVQVVTDAATRLSAARFGAFFYNVINDTGESYMLYTISGVPREAFSKFPMPRNTAVFDPTFSGTGNVRSDDIRKDPRYGRNAPHHGMPQGHLPVVSYLAVPVVSRSGAVLGGLFFGHEQPGVFTAEAEAIVTALAAHAAVAIDNARLYADARRNERRYRALVLAAAVPMSVWAARPDGSLHERSTSWEELTGQTYEEMQGDGWLNAVHPEDREAAMRAWRAATAGGAMYDTEYRLRRPDGTWRWTAARGVAVRNDAGQVEEWIGTTTDIEERKAAQERLVFLAHASEILSASLDYNRTLRTIAQQIIPRLADWCAIDMVDAEGKLQRLITAHPDPARLAMAEELQAKYPANPEAPGGPWKVLRTGRTEIIADITDAMIVAGALSPEHLRLLRELRLRSFLCVPIKVRGSVAGVITMIYAESGRHYTPDDVQLAEELARRASHAIENARLYDEALAASRAKDEFLATLSHELRTPMTAILGWASLLGEDLDPETRATAVDTIRRSSQMQAQLIDDVLDVSRMVTGKLQLHIAPLNLRSLVREVLDSVRPSADARNLRIEVIDRAPSLVVHGDPTRLQQILWNLLTNAIKFTPPGGRVEVDIERDAAAARLVVRDSGQGIAPDFLPYVFDPFRQADESSTRTHGGLGLGLAIVRYLVQAHGGVVRAESSGTGRGATFTVELPLRASRAENARMPPPRSDTPAVSEYPNLDGRRILVVDDQADAREMIRTVLERCGATVTLADSASAGSEAFAATHPDLVISDIAMPGGDGYELLSRIRLLESGPVQTPAIALTAFGRPQDRDAALHAGFADYLKKPVEPRVLAETVRRFVG
ncbi:MAG TPA: GAF domain-containing protein [Thermoanaerobaculia bacterium]|nr:GAF domain-containing protein [Thermoanaerobaculia bacterium]